jgi:cytochrome P450
MAFPRRHESYSVSIRAYSSPMSEDAVLPSASSVSSSDQPAVRVASFLADLDVNRPRRPVPSLPRGALRHLPGETGIVRGIRSVAGFTREGNAYFVEQVRRFGPVHRSQFATFPVVFVGSPELILRVVRNDDGAFSAALAWRTSLEGLDTSSDALDAPLTFDGDLHKEVRKLLQPAFHATALAGYVEMAAPLFARAIDGWLADGRVAFKREIRGLLARASSRMFAGIDDEHEAEAFDRALADIWGAQLALSKSRWLSPRLARATRAHARLRTTLRAQIPKRRAAPTTDLFGRLCAESNGPEWMDDDGLVRLFLGVMLGAFDTTSSAVASMAYLLAKHPDWQEKLRQEVLALGPGPVSPDDLKRFERVDRVWRETLRLFPVAPDTPRVTLRDVELGGLRIPAGTGVLALLGVAMQDPTWWTEPARFDPDRFDPARAEDKRHKGLFLPFGAGAHACIGAQLANAEVKSFWHAMLTRCRFRLDPEYDGHHQFLPLGIVSGDVALRVEPITAR